MAFRSLTEQIDTTTPQGEFLFHIFGALAQFERSLTQERVMAGLAAATPPGPPGRPAAGARCGKAGAVVAALDGGATKAAVCRTFGIKRSTLIDTLARIGWARRRQGPARATSVARRPQLTEAQIAALFDPPTDPRELVRHYTLSAGDLASDPRCRGDHNRLGYALMLATCGIRDGR